MRSMSDESRLAQAAAGGDGEAFALLYDRYERPIYNYCFRLLGNQHDAQDATQDAFVKVMRRLPQMGERELDFGPYLYTTARNASYDMIEKRKRAEPVEEIADGTGQPLGSGPALDEDPVRAAMLAADQDSIRAANSRLPARQREVLALREIEGMSYEDIADLMEMNANSVAQLISRARIRLRKELQGEAAAAVATSSPDCDRALPLLTMRQDGKLGDGEDQSWLDAHLVNCPTCPLAAEAMAEAGVSYRAWAPVIPAAWLFRDTLAKASEAVGADWSGVERPSQQGDQAGAGAEGSTGGTSSGAAADAAGATAAADAESRRRKRGLLVGSLVAALLLGGLVSTVVGGERDAPADTSSPSTFAGSTDADEDTTADRTAKSKQNKTKKKAKSRTTPKSGDVSTSPVTTGTPSSPTSVAAEPNDSPTNPRPQGGNQGSGDWGDRDRSDPPKTTPETETPTTTPEETTPPTTPDPPPDTTTDPPPRDPPTDPKDPPTRPCAIRVC